MGAAVKSLQQHSRSIHAAFTRASRVDSSAMFGRSRLVTAAANAAYSAIKVNTTGAGRCMVAIGTGVTIAAFSSNAGCQAPVQPSPDPVFTGRWNDPVETDSTLNTGEGDPKTGGKAKKKKKKRKAKSAMPGGVGGFECPLCAMVKAGPCEYTFYPFEECLIRSNESGEDTWAACKDEFMGMMRCMAEFKQEYDKIIKETMPEDSTDPATQENGEAGPAPQNQGGVE